MEPGHGTSHRHSVNGCTNSKYILLLIFLYFSLTPQLTTFCYFVVHFQWHISSETFLVPYSLSTRWRFVTQFYQWLGHHNQLHPNCSVTPQARVISILFSIKNCSLKPDKFYRVYDSIYARDNPGPTDCNLKFFHWNLDSLTARDNSKISLIEAYNSVFNYHLIAISDTRLDRSISKGIQLRHPTKRPS